MSDSIQYALWILADVLKYAAYAATIFYAPFAKTWLRALLVPFVLALGWGVVREVSIFSFPEDSPPGIYFFVVPLEYPIFASIIRGLKLFLFRLPVLKSLEMKLRSRFTTKIVKEG
jgi:hypothetical protein